MDYIDAMLLGLVQGATEFLPVSSSGHLALAQYFWGLQEAGLTFDVALHMGTLAAIFLYFRNDFLLMGRAALAPGSVDEKLRQGRRVLLCVCLGTLPAVAAGLLFHEVAENSLRAPAMVATTLAVIGLVLLLAERFGSRTRDFASLTLRDALLVGLLQALAIVPGVSRSGITMSTALFLGLNRTAAARFSFLLSAPIILGAGVLKFPQMLSQAGTGGELGFFAAGFGVAAVSGYLFIAFLLRFVQTRSLAVFAYYRFLVAGVALAVLFFGRAV